MTLHRTLINSVVLQNEASSFFCMLLRAGVDIREDEQGCHLGPLFETFALIVFVHCFV